MLTADRKRVAIFERGIVTNQTLQKSVKEIEKNHDSAFTFSSSTDMAGILMGIGGGSIGGSTSPRFFSSTSSNLWDGLDFPVKTSFSSRRGEKFYKKYLKLRRTFSKKKLPPTEFFNLLKNNSDGFGDIDSHIEEVNTNIVKLEKSGQSDMKELFQLKLSILQAEKTLKENKFDQFLTEKNLVKFILKSVRGLRLDYLLNFNREIPDTVILTKDKAEELALFDNYVILHYDPDAAELLKKEVQAKEEKKDPILFGLINGSNKFYFIDDWIDEKCDLTYSNVIESLGVDEKIQ